LKGIGMQFVEKVLKIYGVGEKKPLKPIHLKDMIYKIQSIKKYLIHVKPRYNFMYFYLGMDETNSSLELSK
jgi:hypothetical protein